MKGVNNQNLFSNHYLNELLSKENEWNTKVEPSYTEIKSLFDSKQGELSSFNESQLRKHFLDKIFEILGFTIDVEPPAASEEGVKSPDYAFFKDEETFKSVSKQLQLKGNGYFASTLCIGEAKKWNRPLDVKLKTDEDPGNPSFQISHYLWLTSVRWGILTNGKLWRLYEREASKWLDTYYEIDLENLIRNGTINDFKYFYLFFRAEAFPDFLDKVYVGSVNYAEAVGEELKENVYKALKVLSEGFLKTQSNGLSSNSLKEIHDNSLILLYRLLFILYAECRELLPLNDNKLYAESYSFDTLKKEIAQKLNIKNDIPATTFQYWNKLKELFEIINIGNKELNVPPYNGGLFSTEKHPFLEQYRLGDFYIAQTVGLLSRSGKGDYIDYRSLEIRHLGSIYEGLLEYKIKVAEQDLYAIKEKGKEIIIPTLQKNNISKKIKEHEVIKTGEIYLITDKGERKATGSYYTPDYIVEYIVENTLGPIVEEKEKQINDKISGLKEKYKKSKGINRDACYKELQKMENNIIDEILSIKVLDPAMGSGHFLVEVVDFLAHKLIKVVEIEHVAPGNNESNVVEAGLELPNKNNAMSKEESDEEDIRWARREVVEKCIFGVDLNPLAVELAKLSLWLHTVAKNRPLNFLDHHLRCGNSLIGAKINELTELPDLKKKAETNAPKTLSIFENVFKEKINILLSSFAQIEKLPSDTVEEIRNKEKLYQDFRRIVSNFQDIADIWMSVHFDNKVEFSQYQKLQENLRAENSVWENLRNEPWFKKAKAIAEEKRFFHWELEFPEIFFKGHNWKENPGFDCVIGNPPYRTLALGKRQEPVEIKELGYFREFYPESSQYKTNTFSMFFDNGLRMSRRHGKTSMILPLTILSNHYFGNFRKLLLEKHKIDNIVEIKQKVFSDAEIGGNSILLVTASTSDNLNKILFTEIDDAHAFNYKVAISQNDLLSLPDFKILSNKAIVELLIKLQSRNVPLNSVALFYNGIKTGNNDKFLSESPVTSKYRKVIRGRDVDRYYFDFGGIWVLFDPDLLWSNTNKEMFEADKKIIVRQTGDTLVGSLDKNQFYTMDTTHLIIPISVDILYLLTLINSTLLNWYHRQIVPEEGKAFAEVKIVNLEKLPITHIPFTTPKKERKKQVGKFKGMYGQFLDEIETDPTRVMEFVKEEFSAGRSDVIHDILAFLAEQMIEMNKTKNEEIKGFLKWLEREIGRDIEALANKTAIKEYHTHSFEQVLDILKQNKNKISIDPSDRKKQEMFENHFKESIAQLNPLKHQIGATDTLIDQIVYRLYGITEEEKKIIEER